MVHDSYMFFTKNEIRDKMRVNEDFKKNTLCDTICVYQLIGPSGLINRDPKFYKIGTLGSQNIDTKSM